MHKPAERRETIRESLRKALEEAPATAHDLSGLVGIPEKDVAAHLEHLQKSLHHDGKRLHVTPAACLACGFAFKERSRLTKPGRCPACASERIEPPVFRVAALGESG